MRLPQESGSFSFIVGIDEEGQFTVLSETEPLFCFVRKTEKEAIKAAHETFRDYVERFILPHQEARKFVASKQTLTRPFKHITPKKQLQFEYV